MDLYSRGRAAALETFKLAADEAGNWAPAAGVAGRLSGFSGAGPLAAAGTAFLEAPRGEGLAQGAGAGLGNLGGSMAGKFVGGLAGSGVGALAGLLAQALGAKGLDLNALAKLSPGPRQTKLPFLSPATIGSGIGGVLGSIGGNLYGGYKGTQMGQQYAQSHAAPQY